MTFSLSSGRVQILQNCAIIFILKNFLTRGSDTLIQIVSVIYLLVNSLSSLLNKLKHSHLISKRPQKRLQDIDILTIKKLPKSYQKFLEKFVIAFSSELQITFFFCKHHKLFANRFVQKFNKFHLQPSASINQKIFKLLTRLVIFDTLPAVWDIVI